MTSLERVRKTIRHEEPDRVPVGEWGIDHDHVTRIIGRHTYWRNRKDTTLALWQGRRDEVVEGLKRDAAELIEALDYDVVTVGLVPPKGWRCEDPPRQTADGTWEDSAGRVYRYAASNDSIICVTPPPAKERLLDEDIRRLVDALECFDETQFELVDYIGERFGRDRAVVFRDLDIYGTQMNVFGGDASHPLVLVALAPDEIKKTHDYAVAYNTKLIRRCVDHHVYMVMHGYDYGCTRGCIMSPQSIRELFMPAEQRVVAEIRRCGMIPFFHCCGRIWEILDDYVQAGYQGYQSIQGTAGMDLAEVKRRYGHSLTLWAGVQCETLITGSLAQTKREVRASLDIGMPGGGFIFGSTNSVQFGARTDNYLKALEVVREHGVY